MAPWFVQALGIALAGLAGLAVSVASSWSILALGATVPAAAEPPVVVSAPVVSARPPSSPAFARLNRVAPPSEARTPAPPLVDTRIPPPHPPAATPTRPTEAEVWGQLSSELDRAWGVDTPHTVQLLEGFIARFPNDPIASEKLYAARIAYGLDLIDAGAISAGVAQLRTAEELLPQRVEASNYLAAIVAAQ